PFMTYEMYTCQGPSRESALPGIIGPTPMQTPRDASLPTAYSEALDALSLGPLWTALHVLLPNERVTSAVPHRWRWRDLRPLLLEAARLVPIAAGRTPSPRLCSRGSRSSCPARPRRATTTRRRRCAS